MNLTEYCIHVYSICAAVGMDRSTKVTYISVNENFIDMQSTMHMLFHVLGRYHEHQRPDRDKYIYIIEKNMIPGNILLP